MNHIKTFDLRKTDKNPLSPKRISTRAVIIKGEKLYLIHLNKTNEYKFPGGGVEINESFEEALIRETKEESGALITNIKSCLGYIDQIWLDKYKSGETFYLRSIYYLCDVLENQVDLNLSSAESKLGFSPRWIDINEAIDTNSALIEKGSKYHWTIRELYMFKYLKKYFKIS